MFAFRGARGVKSPFVDWKSQIHGCVMRSRLMSIYRLYLQCICGISIKVKKKNKKRKYICSIFFHDLLFSCLSNVPSSILTLLAPLCLYVPFFRSSKTL